MIGEIARMKYDLPDVTVQTGDAHPVVKDR
jgi:hypothetical protein